jgi:hypothetical protein
LKTASGFCSAVLESRTNVPALNFESWEATTGFEPVIAVLQTAALPLGYVAAVESEL